MIHEVLLENWDYAMDTEDWWPPLATALNGVDSTEAGWKPQGGNVNSIWETVNHLTFYKERLLRKLAGLPQLPDLENNEATFTVAAAGEEAWEQAVSKLKSVHASLRKVIVELGGAAFDQNGGDQSPGKKLMSLIQHDAYHTGQIILLRKLQNSWPSNRSF
jgi:uncharacterized damage-inducible protein DinB